MEKAIEIKNVKKKIKDREIIRGISFDIFKGDIFGYLGANGAGKTTTIRILLDLLSIDSGEVIISGKNNTDPDARNKIGFILDADGLYNNLDCYGNLEFYSNLYGKQAGKEQIDSLLDLVNLIDRGKDKVGAFSRGMRQRLALARALVHDPEILILDEPMTGIDPPGQMEIRKLLVDIVKIHNKTIFFSSHNLDEVQRLCNRIALIDIGEIKLYGNLQELLSQKDQNRLEVRLSGDIQESVINRLKNQNKIEDVTLNNKTLSIKITANTSVNDILPVLTAEGLQIEEIMKKHSSLEEIYDRIIKQRGN